jgi:hypothetical protein
LDKATELQAEVIAACGTERRALRATALSNAAVTLIRRVCVRSVVLSGWLTTKSHQGEYAQAIEVTHEAVALREQDARSSTHEAGTTRRSLVL